MERMGVISPESTNRQSALHQHGCCAKPYSSCLLADSVSNACHSVSFLMYNPVLGLRNEYTLSTRLRLVLGPGIIILRIVLKLWFIPRKIRHSASLLCQSTFKCCIYQRLSVVLQAQSAWWMTYPSRENCKEHNERLTSVRRVYPLSRCQATFLCLISTHC